MLHYKLTFNEDKPHKAPTYFHMFTGFKGIQRGKMFETRRNSIILFRDETLQKKPDVLSVDCIKNISHITP